MKAGTILLIIHDVVEDLKDAGLLQATGDFAKVTIASVVALATTLNATIAKYGITEHAEVQKIVSAISMLGPLL